MRWYEIRRALLLESFKSIRNKFQDQEDIDKYIDKFKKLKNENLLPKNRSDISDWQSYSWDKFKNLIDAYWDNKRLINYFNKTLESIDIENNDDWHIVVPLNHTTSRKYGTNTKWCVSSSNAKEMFKQYFYINKETLIFFINKTTKDKWAIHYKDKSNIQYVNAKDNYLNKQTFEQKSGIDSEKYIDMVINNYQDVINRKRIFFERNRKYLSKNIRKLRKNTRDIEIEKKLIINGNRDQFNTYVQKVYANNDTSLELPIFFKKEAIDSNPNIFDILKPKRKERIKNHQEKLNKSKFDPNTKQEKLQSYIYNLIKEETYSIKDILDAGIEPNEKVQLEVVRQDGKAIEYILKHLKTASERVQLAAVNQNGHAIEYILEHLGKASERVQLTAVNQAGWTIEHILRHLGKASENVQLTAVKQDGMSIISILEYLKTASEDVQLAAVSRNGMAIQAILYYSKTETSENVQLTAVNQAGLAIHYILYYLKTASEKVWITAFKDNRIWVDIDEIYNLMIKENIKMPSTIQLFIVKNKPEHFNKKIITDPTALEYMRQNHPEELT